MILVDGATLDVVAETPLKVTAVAPVKFVPAIVTVVPTGPKVGVNEVIVGDAGARDREPLGAAGSSARRCHADLPGGRAARDRRRDLGGTRRR